MKFRVGNYYSTANLFRNEILECVEIGIIDILTY